MKMILCNGFLCWLLVLISCDVQERQAELKRIAKYKLEIAEPSSLCYSYSTGYFVIACDKTDRVYFTARDGKVIRYFDTKAKDAEGAVQLKSDSSIWLVDERKREALHYTSDGDYIDEAEIPVEERKSNHGPEGITFNPEKQEFYIVNEQQPRMLLLLDLNMKLKEAIPLDFARDFSDLFYEEESNSLWLLSELSKRLYQCDLRGNLKKTYRFDMNGAEGVVVDSKNKMVYLVSDGNQALYEYQLED